MLFNKALINPVKVGREPLVNFVPRIRDYNHFLPASTRWDWHKTVYHLHFTVSVNRWS